MYEYSTHDTTVCPLGVTLGDQGYDTFLPPFGATMLIELLERPDKTYYVRVLRGRPQRDGDDEYHYMDTGFTQHCIDSNGEMYVAEDNICPLEDFVRLVDYSKPAVPDGECIMNQTLFARMKCPETIYSGGYMSSDCVVYRIACPRNSCPTGYILSLADYQCYPSSYTGSGTTTTTTTTTTTSTLPPSNSGSLAVPAEVKSPSSSILELRRRRVARQLVQGVTMGSVAGAALSHQS